MSIHASAVVSRDAEIASDVEIGPFSIIEAGVRIDSGCQLAGRVTVKSGTMLGKNNLVLEGTTLGGLPQHTQIPENPGKVVIGDGNMIRENVTIHRSLYGDGQTKVGNGCLLMVNSHVAHDCDLHDQAILTNNVMLAGHVTVGERAYLAGAVAVHQFCRVGRLAMVGGLARIRQDVPPFVTIDGGSSMVVGLNKVGLRRAGFSRQELSDLKSAYHVIYRSGERWEAMLDLLAERYVDGPSAEFLPFFQEGTRGFVQERRSPPAAVVRLMREEKDDAADGEAKRLAG